MRWRLARSYLFAPGSHVRLLEKVFTAGADAVVLDLEEAVAYEHKSRARDLVRAVLAERGRGPGPLLCVRVNSVQSGLWRDDLAAIVTVGLDGVRVARTEASADLDEVDAELSKLEVERGLAPGTVAVIASIESARAVAEAPAIARSRRVRGLALAETDFLHDVGASPGEEGRETLYAQSRLVVVSRAAGLQPPIASVHGQLGDDEGLRRSSEAARRLGFFGRSCLHPAQLGVVHEVFTPGPADLARARLLVEAFEGAADRRPGGATLADGQFADASAVDRARALLELAERLGLDAPGP